MYLGLGILFEYGMKIPMGFYNVPIVVSFLTALLVACLQNRSLNFDEKLEVMAGGIGDKNIVTMILIFLTFCLKQSALNFQIMKNFIKNIKKIFQNSIKI